MVELISLPSSSLVLSRLSGCLFDGEEFFVGFAQFEERAKESERARVLYKYALEVLPKSQAAAVYKKYVQFEKQHGDRRGIEDVITSKKRFAYEEAVKRDPYMYDAWFDYVKLEEEALGSLAEQADPSEPPDEASCARVREVCGEITHGS